MNLTKLFEAQKALDERIIEEKGLQGQNLIPKKVLALITELGECANEWRGFKFWSEDREPRTLKRVECETCFGTGLAKSNMRNCSGCKGSGKVKTNPLLEEYVDCLHFALSLVIDTHGDITPLNELSPILRSDTPIEYQFALATRETSSISLNDEAFRKMSASHALRIVLGLGQALGFTEKQIVDAYFAKNKTNHKRQEEHY